MKSILFILCCCSYCLMSEAQTEANQEDIAFYQTNLVCGAAPDIGCGTRAKPLLREFMNHPDVEAAYLNHTGTVIAVIWKESAKDRLDTSNKIFASDNRPFMELHDEARADQLENFRDGKWYLGNEVDQLSMIEAGRIADQLTAWIENESSISDEDKQGLREAFEEYIKREFLAIEDASVIDRPDYWQRWELELTDIGKDFLGDRMPELKLFSVDDTGADTKSKACCTSKSANSACCTKTKSSACCAKANTEACCSKSN